VKFLITAGPTREPIDPVRYLSNRSSGKMGYAIAQAALEARHDVVLISGPVDVDLAHTAKMVRVQTADEMFTAVGEHVADCDVCVMCAAVADYKPERPAAQKLKKGTNALLLKLVPTRDILRSLGAMQDRQFLLVGFAAETEKMEENALTKLREKNCDIMVANDANLALENDENEVTVLFWDGEMKKISRAPKKIVARALIKIFANTREKCLTKNP
jgi:phosphopantothenoylcysteine decarboxylase / phosphopantothenate---cysteine ligase